MSTRARMRELRLRVKAEGDRVLSVWDADREDEAREPMEASDRPAARYYAPRGKCEYCDRRRAAAARSMRGVRERGGGEG